MASINFSEWSIDSSLDGMGTRVQKIVEQIYAANKTDLALAIKEIAKALKVNTRNALAYAEGAYSGPMEKTGAIVAYFLDEIAAHWSKVLAKPTTTINRPDRMVLYGGPVEPVVLSSLELRGALSEVGKSRLKSAGGNGFRAARSLEEIFLLTNYCVGCGRNSGIRGNLSDRNEGIGHLWFDSGTELVQQALRAYLVTQHGLNAGQAGWTSAVAGLCHLCRSRCERCNQYPSLTFDPIEVSSLASEGLCRQCAKYSLAMVEAPKFNRKEFRRLRDNLKSLRGGTEE